MAARSVKSKSADVAAAVEDERAKQLNAFITSSRRKGRQLFTFTSDYYEPVEAISTGALSLDFAIGIGGVPRGRVTEIYGPESAGKTSLALSIAATATKSGGLAGMVDVEHAITESHAKSMGVDVERLALVQPSSGEEAFELMEAMLKENIFDVLILDSVAMLTPKVELEGNMDDLQVGAQARMVGKGLRKIMAIVGNSNTAVVFINQLRTKIGGYGNPEDTPGGKSLRYNAALRMDVRAPASKNITDPKDAKVRIGLGTTVRVVKNKLATPQKTAEYDLIWGKGIDSASSVFAVAKDLGVLEADPGNAYTIVATGEKISEDGKAIRGAANVKAYVAERPELVQLLTELCQATLVRNESADVALIEGDDGSEEEMLAEIGE